MRIKFFFYIENYILYTVAEIFRVFNIHDWDVDRKIQIGSQLLIGEWEEVVASKPSSNIPATEIINECITNNSRCLRK